jgi:hypothetical protein
MFRIVFVIKGEDLSLLDHGFTRNDYLIGIFLFEVGIFLRLSRQDFFRTALGMPSLHYFLPLNAGCLLLAARTSTADHAHYLTHANIHAILHIGAFF